VNNNWYTNRIAVWCLEYTMEVLAELRRAKPDSYRKLVDKLQLQQSELEHWSDIAARMYYPYVEELGVFEQQDGFMDKELLTVADLSPEDLPLNQNWSWTASYAPASSSRPMCCRACSSWGICMIWRQKSATSISMNP